MNQKRVVASSIGILVLLGACAVLYFTQRDSYPRESQVVYEKAPNFTLPTSEGEMVTLEALKGEITILNFWASWSPYSKEELAALTTLKLEYGSKIDIAALNRDSNPAEGREFLNSLNLGDALVFVYDTQDEYYKKVNGFAMPETLFLDSQGNIIVHQHGPMTYDEMLATIDRLLN